MHKMPTAISVIALPSNLKGTLAFVFSKTESMLYKLIQNPRVSKILNKSLPF